jgi:signal transduction histidine kinase
LYKPFWIYLKIDLQFFYNTPTFRYVASVVPLRIAGTTFPALIFPDYPCFPINKFPNFTFQPCRETHTRKSMKYRIPVFLLLIPVLWLTGCGSGNDERNSIAHAGQEKAKSDSMNILDDLVQKTKVTDNSLSRKYANRAFSLAATTNSVELKAQASMIAGIAFKNYNDDSSYHYSMQAIRMAEKYDLHRIRISAMYNIAMVYYDAADLKTAILYLDSTVNLCRGVKMYFTLSNAYNVIGNIRHDLSDTAGERVMYDSALDVARKHGLKMQMGIALASLSRLESNYKIKEDKRKQAISLLKDEPGAEEEMALIYTNLGAQSRNPDSAIQYYQEAQRLANTIHSSELTIGICNNKAYTFLDKNDWKSAEDCLLAVAIPLAKKENDYDQLANLYDTYTDVLIAAKRNDEALKYARMAYLAKGIAEKSSGKKQVRLLTMLLDVKNKELSLARKEQELRQKENRTRRMIILFSAAFFLLALAIFFIVWRLQRNRLRYNDSMLKAAKKIIEAEDRERTRIGRDFHDLTGQKFSGLSGFLESQEFPDPESRHVALRMLDEIRQAVREMSHRMNRAWVERFTLEESISGLCTDCIKLASLNLEYSIPEKFPEMPRETKIHLFRIVQELLTNAMQYARSAHIVLDFSFDESSLRLKYSDDGPGFDSSDITNRGSGLDNILERVKLLGGTVDLDTRPGFGTDYQINIPLNE